VSLRSGSLLRRPGFIPPKLRSYPVSTIGLFEQSPVILQVFPVYRVAIQLVEPAVQATQQATVILDGERPTIEQNMAIGAQA